MVGHQTLLEGVGVVVRTLDQRLASDVVLHVLLRRVEDLVVRAARGRVDQTTSNTVDQQLVVNLELNGIAKRRLALGKHRVQTLGLGNGSGKAVQNETVLALGVVLQLVLDHVDHDFVRNKATLVHDLLSLEAEGSLLGNLRTQHITGSQVAGAVLLLEVRSLGSLA